MTKLFTDLIDSLRVDESGETGRYVQLRYAGITALSVFAAKRISDQLDALIIYDVNTRALRKLSGWPRSKHFEVIPETITPGPSGKVNVILQLLDRGHQDVFGTFVNDACTVMEADGMTEKTALMKFHERLVKWQSFLQKSHEMLTDGEQIGLYGELFVLRELMLPNTPQNIAVEGWRGPEGGHQDFQFSGMALEVKTTSQVDLKEVTINNVQQLDDDGLDPLLLTVVQFHRNEATGETLPEMVKTLRDCLGKKACDGLDRRLQTLGYSDVHREHYLKKKYQPVTCDFYRVSEGFPRLMRKDVPAGVGGVKYQVNLGACKPFEITKDMVISSLKKSME